MNKKTISRQDALLPMIEGVPRYKDFNTIRKSHHGKDEDILRYVPYFGETDDIDLTEVYKIDVRTPEEEEDLESMDVTVEHTNDRVEGAFEDCGEVS